MTKMKDIERHRLFEHTNHSNCKCTKPDLCAPYGNHIVKYRKNENNAPRRFHWIFPCQNQCYLSIQKIKYSPYSLRGISAYSYLKGPLSLNSNWDFKYAKINLSFMESMKLRRPHLRQNYCRCIQCDPLILMLQQNICENVTYFHI